MRQGCVIFEEGGSQPGRSSHAFRTMLVALGVLLSVRPASAQPAGYITGSGFTDIKRFSSTGEIGYLGGEDSSLDGTGAGGGLRIGTFLHPRLSLELAVDAGTRTQVEFPSPYATILAIYPLVRFPKLTASTRFLTVSTLVGFHPPAHGRVRFGYLAGFSFVRSTYKSDYLVRILPATATLSSISFATANVVAPVIYPPPIPSVSALTQTDNTNGAILGFEAAVDLTTHLAVVPEIRALTFARANGGPGVFLLRPGVGVRWSF